MITLKESLHMNAAKNPQQIVLLLTHFKIMHYCFSHLFLRLLYLQHLPCIFLRSKSLSFFSIVGNTSFLMAGIHLASCSNVGFTTKLVNPICDSALPVVFR
mmetsp:Transcript_61822/g.91816  ORF Transcript_61822/g.91816 Transcript_61822/m.91816 type:complete len:101 (+) Transcript_61822:283-585(+)